MAKVKAVFINLIYLFILIPLLYIALSVVWQSIKYPEEIPNIFGYKLFMILDEDMDAVEYGDLVFTKNIKRNDVKNGDIIAYRNISDNKVRIVENYGTEDFLKIEGLLIKRIPKIGAILYFIQQPLVMAIGVLIILTIGGICIYIAGKLDERDMKKAEAQKS